ncbi:ommochrome-binding protein-like [Leguminivora glycinivorella]|uniref:ommochrome-binding protein-like n=1 Tax=Leguminivora glycinivorella TaxID=1035111 RepID=UPI00200BA27D|nr:ommochrome-binding protein-like [Leguminivora glycinivorella]
MGRTLPVIFATLVLQALWSSAFSSLLGPRPAATYFVDQAEVEGNEYCHSCIKIDNKCYNHTLMFELPAPFGEHPVVKRMGIMRATNILYYTFEPQFSDKEYSKVGFVSLHSTRYSGVVSGWQTYNFGPFDINQKEKKVYLGGSDGIWTVNSTSHIPSFFGVKGNLITNVVVKDYLYFSKSDHQGIVKYVNGMYVEVLGNRWISNFVLDKTVAYNIVYLNETGLWISFNSKNQKDVRLSTERFIRGLTVDMKGAVYAWHVDGIYKVVVGSPLSQSTLKHVARIAPDAMAFDESNNIIYSNGKTLYKLSVVATNKCW